MESAITEGSRTSEYKWLPYGSGWATLLGGIIGDGQNFCGVES